MQNSLSSPAGSCAHVASPPRTTHPSNTHSGTRDQRPWASRLLGKTVRTRGRPRASSSFSPPARHRNREGPRIDRQRFGVTGRARTVLSRGDGRWRSYRRVPGTRLPRTRHLAVGGRRPGQLRLRACSASLCRSTGSAPGPRLASRTASVRNTFRGYAPGAVRSGTKSRSLLAVRVVATAFFVVHVLTMPLTSAGVAPGSTWR